MSTAQPLESGWRLHSSLLEWLPVLVGLLVLYVPTLYFLATIGWDENDWGHGPIILALICWLVWNRRASLLEAARQTAPVAGFIVLSFGLLMYVIGRVNAIIIFEAGSLVPVLAGSLLAMRGWRGLREFWFAPVFAAFLVPPPGMYSNALTWPLKRAVSAISEQILYVAGYPIALDGVTLSIGQYRLLVADACAGLNSMFSLTALGLMYVCLMRYPDWRRNAVILISLLPIAFCANVVRVMFLVLITYHFGDAVGQGFLHGFSGLALFVIALTLVLLVDTLFGKAMMRRSGS